MVGKKKEKADIQKKKPQKHKIYNKS